ncbi:MAG TPA: hypothetical protein VF192_01235 [Longimicrobiales bacterium]
MAIPELEVLNARRAWAESQALLGAVPSRTLGRVDVGWHVATTHPEVGAFAVARSGGPYDVDGPEELVGDILRLSVGGREVFVFCVGGADVPTDLSLSRPAFFKLDLLTRESVDALVEVI